MAQNLKLKFYPQLQRIWTLGKPLSLGYNHQITFVFLQTRPIANDLKKGELLFAETNYYPGQVPYKSMLASVGRITEMIEPEIGIISTGDELVEPGTTLGPGKIYDSNMTMLKELLKQFGFTKIKSIIAKDE